MFSGHMSIFYRRDSGDGKVSVGKSFRSGVLPALLDWKW